VRTLWTPHDVVDVACAAADRLRRAEQRRTPSERSCAAAAPLGNAGVCCLLSAVCYVCVRACVRACVCVRAWCVCARVVSLASPLVASVPQWCSVGPCRSTRLSQVVHPPAVLDGTVTAVRSCRLPSHSHPRLSSPRAHVMWSYRHLARASCVDVVTSLAHRVSVSRCSCTPCDRSSFEDCSRASTTQSGLCEGVRPRVGTTGACVGVWCSVASPVVWCA
jgi:hypothetical protein